MRRPEPSEYAEYQAGYMAKVPDDVVPFAIAQADRFAALLGNADESVGDVIHPPYGWTIKQVVSHINDGERVFGYRALRLSVNDSTDLPGFDEHHFVDNTALTGVPLADLSREFQQLRVANLSLFARIPADSLGNAGTADGKPITLRAMHFLIAGHAEHHLQILEQRLA